ncbi:PulJ/GspJ family protein [[Mannheimia] succiniciproducens]|uniref:Type II secretory pathway, component PulJ n=1 Tax=Mannheimia succiniciproducens (strain KCTC 0769BP / MBEL55E) TaxID=221988 RepID=Q65UM8_MANSM|nr:hypothetical protein [[Mannheimia] succiniciproducens]AAU37332.1 unknown [[Mannheimia] succiniciproducens MBEL55E]
MMIYRGETLVGLLISMTLSAFLILIAVQFYVYVQHTNLQVMQRLELQAELQSILQIIAKDLRRTGFDLPYSEPEKIKFDHFSKESPNSCVIFTYGLGESDKTKLKKQNTEEDTKVVLGYRLYNQRLEAIPQAKKTNTERNEKTLVEGCSLRLGWEQLIDSDKFAVSQLQFKWLVEKKGIEIYLKGYLKQQKSLFYETSIILPIMNEVMWDENL